MLNTCVLVGFIKETPVICNDKGESCCTLKIETDRPYRDSSGRNSTDVFEVRIWRGIAEEILDACRPGMMIAVKGRLYADSSHSLGIIAENISFPGRLRTMHLEN